MNQRAQYAHRAQGQKTWLSEDRIQLLTDIGFIWTPHSKKAGKKKAGSNKAGSKKAGSKAKRAGGKKKASKRSNSEKTDVEMSHSSDGKKESSDGVLFAF